MQIHTMFALLAVLLPLGVLCLEGNFPHPETVEIDLVFPRNNTYAVSEPLPVVFAVQNANIIWPLGLSILLEIRKLDPPGVESTVISFPLESDTNSTTGNATSDPAIFAASANITKDTEGEWILLWSFRVENGCSDDGEGFNTYNPGAPRSRVPAGGHVL